VTGWLWVWVCASGLAHAAPATRMLFSLSQVPVGTVEWTLEGSRFEYRSTQVLTRGTARSQRVRTARYTVVEGVRDAGSKRVLPTLFLARLGFGQGCVEALDELSKTPGPVCITRVEGSRVEGTLMGQAFTADYGEEGGLRVLRLGSARFEAWTEDSSPVPHPPDLYGQGLPISGDTGELRFEPPGEPPRSTVPLQAATARRARALADQVHRAFGEKRDALCLEVARAYVDQARAQGLRAALVDGLQASRSERRAFPHVWVRVVDDAGGWLDLDPTLHVPVLARTHLEVASGGTREEAGRRWLALFETPRSVVRRAGLSGERDR
jgi:hypothetical protein